MLSCYPLSRIWQSIKISIIEFMQRYHFKHNRNGFLFAINSKERRAVSVIGPIIVLGALVLAGLIVVADYIYRYRKDLL